MITITLIQRTLRIGRVSGVSGSSLTLVQGLHKRPSGLGWILDMYSIKLDGGGRHLGTKMLLTHDGNQSRGIRIVVASPNFPEKAYPGRKDTGRVVLFCHKHRLELGPVKGDSAIGPGGNSNGSECCESRKLSGTF